jgi:hypothetical protein
MSMMSHAIVRMGRGAAARRRASSTGERSFGRHVETSHHQRQRALAEPGAYFEQRRAGRELPHPHDLLDVTPDVRRVAERDPRRLDRIEILALDTIVRVSSRRMHTNPVRGVYGTGEAGEMVFSSGAPYTTHSAGSSAPDRLNA